MHPYYAELISSRLITWKLVSLNDSPWFDAMIRNTGNNQSAQRADMSSNLAYSPINIIRDAFNQIQLNPEAH